MLKFRLAKGRVDGAIALMLLVASSSLFFASTAGIFSSNDGSHYALIRSMVDHQSFVINPYNGYTGNIDNAKVGDNYYSDRAPGTALAAAPFYLFGKAFSSIFPLMAYYRGYVDPGNPSAMATLIFSNLCGGASVALVFLIISRMGIGRYAAVLSALVTGFGTILWKYSTSLFSHSFSAFLFLACFYIAIGLKDMGRQRKETAILFFMLGYLPLIEYPNVILSGIFFLYLVYKGVVKVPKAAASALPMAPAIIAPLFLAVYNAVNFGGPTTTAYAHSQHHAWVGSLSESMTTPLIDGLLGLLISGELVGVHPGTQGGIFILTPVFLLSFFGMARMRGERVDEGLLAVGLFLSHLAFYSMFKWWWGGGSADTRYILTITPLLALPLAFWVDKNIAARKKGAMRFLFEGVMWLLVAVSVINVAQDVILDEGTNRRAFFMPAVYPSEIMTTFASVFPNFWGMPVFFGIFAMGYSLVSLIRGSPPGLEGIIAKGQLRGALFAIFVFGFFSTIIFSLVVGTGYEFTNWRYTSNAFNWAHGAPPIGVSGDRLYATAQVFVRGPGTDIDFGIQAKDCVRNIYVNDRKLPISDKCEPCMHCKPFRIDKKAWEALLRPGQNQISFEIISLSGEANLTIVR